MAISNPVRMIFEALQFSTQRHAHTYARVVLCRAVMFTALAVWLAGWRWQLVPVSSTADGTSDSAEKQEYDSDDEQDNPECSENADSQEVTQDRQDQPEHDHYGLRKGKNPMRWAIAMTPTSTNRITWNASTASLLQ